MSGVKLINLGLPKSGTTTLAQALAHAGWCAADHKVRRSQTKDPLIAGTFVARQMYEGYFASGDPLERLGFYDALTEISALKGEVSFWPQCDYALLKALRLRHPEMLFVATWRPARDISDSMRRWTNLGSDRLPVGAIPGLPTGFGAKNEERLRWIDGHYAMLRDLFGDDPRFLQLDMAAPEARAQLSEHIHVDLPWWGRANVNPTLPSGAPETAVE